MVTDSRPSSQPLGFARRVRARARESGSWLCIGLDPEVEFLPSHLPRTPAGVTEFCTQIVDATAASAVCYKINFAFFEALGPDGWRVLHEVRSAIPTTIPVIGDAKRGDIGNTDEAYARGILDVLDFDAVTVSPYLGRDSIEPFAARPGKCALVLCKTSNPGAVDLQERVIDGEPLYVHVARDVLSWDTTGELGLVVGATQPHALRRVRSMSADLLLLVPGVGAQGAGAAEATRLAANAQGENALISASRQILYASNGRDFARAAASVAEEIAADTRAAT